MKVAVRKWRGAWVTDYTDPRPGADGKRRRHIESHLNKRAAEERAKEIDAAIDQGTHRARRQSPTVAEAAGAWIDHCKAEGRERTTTDGYEQHTKLHINPVLGDTKLSDLTRPDIEKFKDRLLQTNSRAMTKKILTSLRSLIGEAMRTGTAAHNPAIGVKVETKKTRPLEVGRDIPMPNEIAVMIAKAPTTLSRAVIALAATAGLRSGELRGLCWSSIDFKRKTVSVKYAMTRHRVGKEPKSHAGHRTIPLPGQTLNALAAWRSERESRFGPTSTEHSLVFCTGTGGPLDQGNVLRRVLYPAEVVADIVKANGEPKYNLHSLRHFFASLCINRRTAGGLELPLKEVSVRLGHASVAITADRYGHLFPQSDNGDDMAQIDRQLFAVEKSETKLKHFPRKVAKKWHK